MTTYKNASLVSLIDEAKQVQFSPAPTVQDRVTVVETVSFQSPGSETYQTQSAFHVVLDSKDGQPFERRIKTSEEWTSLNSQGCWVDKPYFVIVKNDDKQEVEVKFAGACMAMPILPGTSIRFTVSGDLSGVNIRSLSDVARCTLVVLPR